MSDDLLARLKSALAERYLIEEELDRGGMAIVFLAKDLRHERKVAIKVLDPALSATVGTDRFLREIDVLARLQHPNVLTLIDSGQVEDLPYYVMPFVKGQSLAALLEREGRLSLEEAVRIACEVAEALDTAHRQGVVHRDIKPSNVLLSGGHAVVADFGIAAALDESKLGRLTRTGLSLGSPIYMSPEQANGERDLDGRTDIYALGCMVYEMLGGEAPFGGSLEAVVSRKLLGEIRPLKELRPDLPPEIDRAVSRAMERDRDRRFATADEFREALVSGLPHAVPQGWGRKRTLATAAVVLVVAAGAVLAVVQNRAGSQRRIRATRTLAEVERLVDAGHLTEALALADEVEAVFPGDTALARLYPGFSFTIPIRSDPPGARVFIQDLEGAEGEWDFLGTTPLEGVRFAGMTYTDPEGVEWTNEDRPHRLRFELEGYRVREVFKTVFLGGNIHPPTDAVRLVPVDSLPAEMVLVPGFRQDSRVYSDYFMDRFEVTNRQFKEFVDAGGYQSPEHWLYPFMENGVGLSFREALARFTDQTGQPGPSTWRLGTYPKGREDYPVGGVSWYEAAAYAHFAGKELPTTLHWVRAMPYYRQNSYVIAPRSNLGSEGTRPVGQNRSMTTVGVYDLVGNVREWCYNEVGQGLRATRGGAWPDAPFLTGWVIPRPGMDRHETNGIRLVRVFDEDHLIDALRAPVQATDTRDYSSEVPVGDAEYEYFRRLYSYDPFPLNPIVQQVDTFEYWVREKVSFDLPYGERGGAALFIPRGPGFAAPYQAVVYWGGSGLMDYKSIDDEWLPGFDFMARSGRVVAVPIFKGAYERDDSLFSTTYDVVTVNPTGTVYRDFITRWVKDLSTTIDYLEIREDVDAEKLGFFGISFGGWTAPIVLAVETRIKAAVINVGGLAYRRHPPEGDPINFVTRVRTPVLMINGQYDIVFPYETTQVPMYRLLGTDPQDKHHYLAEASHMVPRDELIRETLRWLDKYLGEPERR